jgi:hypothetical protein
METLEMTWTRQAVSAVTLEREGRRLGCVMVGRFQRGRVFVAWRRRWLEQRRGGSLPLALNGMGTMRIVRY